VNPCKPLPTSLPDQLTRKAGHVDEVGRADMWLTGGVLSIVLVHVAVLMDGFASKTTLAVFEIWVPVTMVCVGNTEYETVPCTPGGSTPTVGSAGGSPVVGSTDENCHVNVRDTWFSVAATLTRRFCVGRKSMAVLA
jgi:hypothetical protein